MDPYPLKNSHFLFLNGVFWHIMQVTTLVTENMFLNNIYKKIFAYLILVSYFGSFIQLVLAYDIPETPTDDHIVGEIISKEVENPEDQIVNDEESLPPGVATSTPSSAEGDASQLANVASAVDQVLGEAIGELIPAEEPEVVEDVLVEELLVEESLQPIIEPVPLPPRLSVRNFTKEIIIDPNAAHYCEASPFAIDVSGRHSFSTKIMLQKSPEEDYELEIGSLPEGVDMKFSRNDDYVYEPDSDENTVSLRIRNEEGSRVGNFTVPIIFTQRAKEDSSTICQINIVNVE